MVRTTMSLEDGRGGENSISIARSKLQKLQCLVDLTHRSLQSARSSRSANVDLKCSQIRMQENKLYKYFARQLEVKHSALQGLDSGSEAYTVAEHQLDQLVSMDMFMDVVGVEQRLLPVSELKWTVDSLFHTSNEELESLLASRSLLVSWERLKAGMAMLREVYDEIVNNRKGNRMSSASMPFDEDPSPSPKPSLRHSEVLPPYSSPPSAYSPVQLRSHLPSHLTSSMSVLSASSRGSTESVPGVVRRAQWARGSKGSVDTAQLLYQQRVQRQGPLNPVLYMSSETINKVNSSHLSVPHSATKKGHSRSRSLGNDGLFSISNTSTRLDSFDQDPAHEDPPGRMPSLPSPTLSRSDDHSVDSVPQRSPPAMVKQASVGTYSLDPRTLYSSQSSNPTFTLDRSEDDVIEASSLYMYNCNYSDDEGVEPGKALSLPKLAALSVSAEHSSPRDAFQRSFSEVQSVEPYPLPPTSPRTQGANTPVGLVGHRIPHRFNDSRSFLNSSCDFCNKTMFLGVRCKQCKFKCHKSCAKKVPESCGLPPGLEAAFKRIVLCQSPAPSAESFPIQDLSKEPEKSKYSPVTERRLGDAPRVPTASLSVTSQANLTSPSVSSFSSSSLSPATPISPQTKDRTHFFSVSSKGSTTADESSEHELEARDSSEFGSSSASQSHISSSLDDITDVQRMEGALKRGTRPPPQIVSVGSLPDLHKPKMSTNSEEYGLLSLIHTTGSSVTASTVTNGSMGVSETTDGKLVESEVGSVTNTLVNSVGSDVIDGEVEDAFTLGASSTSQQLNLQKEWEIPYEELKLTTLVREHPFTKLQIWRGDWHGEVLVKMFNVPNATEQQIRKFTHDVAALKHSRHENVILFMGVCSRPPHLAVVTSDFKGHSLYKHIHLWSQSFYSRRAHHIIRQVAQGMGYLHARNIVHKDLTSRNVLLDEQLSDKVVITDVGFNSVTDGQAFMGNHGNKLIIPRGWLNYVSPELLKVLSPEESCLESIQYTNQSDIYAFGILWYELLTSRLPFQDYEPEQIIYSVVNRLQPKASSIPATDNVRDTISKCWSYEPKDRPPFAKILEELKRRMPVTRIASHPAKLSKSMELIAMF